MELQFDDLWSAFSLMEEDGWLAQLASQHLAIFSLVSARLAGFVCLLPFVTGGKLARHLQVLLVLSLALVLTPAVTQTTELTNQTAIFSAAWFPAATAEFALGAGMGIGVYLCLAAFQMAGELIDQQMGLQPQHILQQSGGAGPSLTGQFLFLIGTAAYLSLPAVGPGDRGGLLLFVDSFLQTFQTLPLGFGNLPESSASLLIGWVQHSVSLALLVAMPILSCTMMVAMFVSVVNRSVPDANTLVIGFPLRTMICLTVLLLTLSGMTRRVTQEIPLLLQDFQIHFTG